MTKKQVGNFNAEEKTRIVLELLKENITLAQLSSKYEVSSNSISHWKKQFLSNAAIAFEAAKIVSINLKFIN